MGNDMPSNVEESTLGSPRLIPNEASDDSKLVHVTIHHSPSTQDAIAKGSMFGPLRTPSGLRYQLVMGMKDGFEIYVCIPFHSVFLTTNCSPSLSLHSFLSLTPIAELDLERSCFLLIALQSSLHSRD